MIIISSTALSNKVNTNTMASSLSKDLLIIIDNDHVVNASSSTAASSSSINNDTPVVDDCKAILSTMLSQEKYYVSRPYLSIVSNNSKTKGKSNISSNSTSRSTAVLDVACRTRVCKWIFHIIDIMGLQHETAAIAISYLDRFMSISCAHKPKQKRSTTKCNRREYQLVASTSLYIAIKIHEPFVLKPDVISSLTRGLLTPDNIIACEKIILTTLRWRMNGPTPHQYINYILKLLPSSSTSTSSTANQELVTKLSESSHSWIETAIKDYACIPLRSSTVALSALLNSLEDMSRTDHCLSSEVKYQFIQAISNALEVDNIEGSPLIKACRKRLLDRSTKSSSGSEGVQELPTKPSKNKPQGILESRVSSPVCASIEAYEYHLK